MAQHLVVSCFIMRMPESAISKLVREVGEKWEDAHGRLMVKVLGHAAVGLEPQWTNDSKSMKQGREQGLQRSRLQVRSPRPTHVRYAHF